MEDRLEDRLARTRPPTDAQLDALFTPTHGGRLNPGRLKSGDTIYVSDRDGFCIVDYVNRSGAFVIPKAGTVRTVTDSSTGETKSFTSRKDGFYIGAEALVEVISSDPSYTSRADRRRDTMGTREGAIKAAATRAANRAKAAGASPAESAAAAAEVVAEERQRLARIESAAPPKGSIEDGINQGPAAPAAGSVATMAADGSNDTLPMTEGQQESGDSGEADSDMAKKKAAKGKAAKGSNGAVKARAPKAPKETRDCACGCGEKTSGHFVQGHDARFKGWMLKIERGEAKKSELLKPTVIRAYDWVGTRGGGERTTTNYKGERHTGYDKKTS